MFFSENKFNDKKESYLIKYYRMRSNLTVFLKFLTFSFNKKISLQTTWWSLIFALKKVSVTGASPQILQKL